MANIFAEAMTQALAGKPTKNVIAFFKDGRSATYTMAILESLLSSKDVECVIDAETGEILEG